MSDIAKEKPTEADVLALRTEIEEMVKKHYDTPVDHTAAEKYILEMLARKNGVSEEDFFEYLLIAQKKYDVYFNNRQTTDLMARALAMQCSIH